MEWLGTPYAGGTAVADAHSDTVHTFSSIENARTKRMTKTTTATIARN